MTRRAALVVALAALTLAAGLLVVGSRRVAIAHWLLAEALASRGIAPAALRVTRVDGHGLVLEDVALGPPREPDLGASRVEADWSLRGLLARRLDALRVTGLRVSGTLGGKGLRLGVLDTLFGGSGGGAAPGAPALPFASLELHDARATLRSTAGTAELAASGALAVAPGGGLSGGLDLAFESPFGACAGSVALSGDLTAPGFALAVTLHDASRPAASAPRSLHGTVQVRGRVDLGHAPPTLTADAALRGVGLELAAARLDGVTGTLALQGPPFETRGEQVLGVALLDPGVPLTDGLVRFRLRPDGALDVRSAVWHFAGGEMRADDVSLRAGGTLGGATLRARDVDLATLLARVALPGLAGSGRLEGTIPVTRSPGGLTVQGGTLRAAGEGTLRYAPSDRVRALAASRPTDLGIAVAAFSDFHYELLQADLDGALQGEMKIGLHVRGTNPGFQQGRPVVLNLNLEANVSDLVRAGVTSYRVPEEIEERLRAFSKGGAP
jgi:hypothetical protein